MDLVNKNILLAGEIVAKKWRVAEKIGEGTFSQIYSAFCLDGDDKVAIKVEAPSALKPVLEWESTILKSLQKCPLVCRYHHHGKHAESTVLVMELLGESMSMLRLSADSIHGVPVSKCVGVGIEMLDAIEAFHRHGYVHRDIKASNFALSMPKPGMSTRRRYLLIDFGLSRQHLAEGKVIPARPVAEFRGTSMYASLSAHRRQELGPKDDLWSWFYLVLDFMRGELPWATDAQQKNRPTVLSLKEYYTEKHPGLLVEGLPGGSHLLAIIKYLQGLKYEDSPDYNLLRDRLRRAAAGSEGEDTIELWDALNSDRERALQWTLRATDALQKKADSNVLETLQSVAKKYNTFFDCDELDEDEHMAVQEAVFELETKLKGNAQKFAPPPIQSFKRRQESEQKIRTDALRKRRERDMQIRHSIEQKLRRQSSLGAISSPATDVVSGSATPTKIVETVGQVPIHKSEDSSMDMSDSEEPAQPAKHALAHPGQVVSAPVVVRVPLPQTPRPPPPPPGSFPNMLPPHLGPHFRPPPPPPSHQFSVPGGSVPPFRPPPPPPRPQPPAQAQPSPRFAPERPPLTNGYQRNGNGGYERNGNGNGHRRSRSRSRSPERRSHHRRRSRSRSSSRSRSYSQSSRSRSRSRSHSRSRSSRRSRDRASYSRRRSRSPSRSPSRSKYRRSSSGSHYDDKYRKSEYHRSSPRDDRGRHGSRYSR